MRLDSLLWRLADFTDDAIVITEVERTPRVGRRILWCNESFSRMTGYTLSEIIGRSPRFLQGEETDPQAVREIQDKLSNWQPIRRHVLNYRKDGTPFWVDLSLRPVADTKGRYHYWIGVQRDITGLVSLQQELDAARRSAGEAQQRLWNAIEAVPNAFVIYDRDDRLVICNAQYRKLYDKSAAAIVPGATFEQILRFGLAQGQYPEAKGYEEQWLAERLERHRNPGGPIEQELPGRRFLTVHEVRTSNGDTVGFRNDVTMLKRQQELIEAHARALKRSAFNAEIAARTDSLTGLGNRRGLELHVEELVLKDMRGLQIGLMHIDLDRFKQVNDTLGHAAGDFLLRHVAGILRGQTRPDDFVARIGGDEFSVILTAPNALETAHLVAERLLEAFRVPVDYQGRPLAFGASIGIAVACPEDLPELMIKADTALCEAKNLGRNRIALFTPEVRAVERERHQLAEEILAGLERDEFFAFYQPRVDAHTYRFIGVEALARWQNPRRGLLAPAEFLHIAEELKVTGRIDRAVLNHALDFAPKLVAAGIEMPHVSVNISQRHLLEFDVDRIFAQRDLNGFRLAFELVETIDFDEQGELFYWVVDSIRECGVSIEIDDFGSGRASITSLMKLKPHSIKIDRRIVGAIESDRPDANPLVKAIADMARALGIRMTGEGVETDVQARVLARLGCDQLQGYLFARPMSPEAVLAGLAPERIGVRRA